MLSSTHTASYSTSLSRLGSATRPTGRNSRFIRQHTPKQPKRHLIAVNSKVIGEAHLATAAACAEPASPGAQKEKKVSFSLSLPAPPPAKTPACSGHSWVLWHACTAHGGMTIAVSTGHRLPHTQLRARRTVCRPARRAVSSRAVVSVCISLLQAHSHVYNLIIC